jgi:hypothetical protein
MKIPTSFFVTALVLLVSACGAPEPPANPAWDLDVYPILRGSCGHCHGMTVAPPATPLTRLDVCDGEAFSSQGFPVSVGAKGGAILGYVKSMTPGSRPLMPPPPAGVLSDYDVTVLERWAMRGGNCTKQVENRRPTFLTVKGPTRDNDRVLVTLEFSDPDGDQVLGKVKMGGSADVPILGAGRREFEFTGVNPTDRLSVTLFDGYVRAEY